VSNASDDLPLPLRPVMTPAGRADFQREIFQIMLTRRRCDQGLAHGPEFLDATNREA